MNQKQLITFAAKTYKECLEIIKKKNSDYSDPTKDAFANFSNSEVVKVSRERACLVRIMDKISRISNLIDRKAKVKDETIADSISDLINYSLLLGGMLLDNQNATTKPSTKHRSTTNNILKKHTPKSKNRRKLSK